MYNICSNTNPIQRRAIIKKTKELKILKFLTKEYHIFEMLGSLKRKKFKRILVKGNTVAKMLFIGMFSRFESLNQILEKIHRRNKFKKLFSKKEKIPKSHVFRDGIKELSVEKLKGINKSIISKARDNKLYRAGSIDGLVVVGIDGVEIFGSYKKDWNNSYKVKKKVKEYENGENKEVEKEYHKQIYIFAKIVGKRPGLLLDNEAVTCNGNEGKQEYEPNVGIKLVQKLKNSYGRGIDVIVGDAIYMDSNFLNAVREEGYEAVIRLKDNRKALIEEAEGLFKIQKPKQFKIGKEKEIRSWSEIIEYKEMKIRVAKFEETITKGKNRKVDIIYAVSTDLNMRDETINKIIHARWDIENDGFNELKNYWNMNHCFMADENGINVIVQMIMMSYNLWELYIYGHLHNFEKLKMTKKGYIEMIVERISDAKCEIIINSSA